MHANVHLFCAIFTSRRILIAAGGRAWGAGGRPPGAADGRAASTCPPTRTAARYTSSQRLVTYGSKRKWIYFNYYKLS